jgi:hypothetical protein
MHLEGSCHCGAVTFSLTSQHPYPYQRCYCSICRKTQGGGGYAINLAGEAQSLKVQGRKHISIYHASNRTAPAAPMPVLPNGISARNAAVHCGCSARSGRN